MDLVISVIKFLLPKVYDRAANIYYRKIRSKTIKIDSIEDTASNCEVVRTIWNPENPVNLNTFYYPTSLDLHGQSLYLDDIDKIDNNKKVVIEGNTGQGKSILLKHLAGKEIRKGYKIPIFVELRRIDKENNLESLILRCLSSYGIEIKKNHLPYLLEDERVSLLLDAFDEIKEDLIERTFNEIEGLCVTPSLKILVTSRKDQEIQKSVYFVVSRMQNVHHEEFENFFKKLFYWENNIARDLSKEILREGHELTEMSVTPLMLTMLAISYKVNKQIPKTMIEFYDGLFLLLISRHDRSKPNFSRKFKSGLDVSNLENFFVGLSFLCVSTRQFVVNREAMVELLPKVASFYNIESTAFKEILHDISVNTNLLLPENETYVFMHRSIAEFSAARFVRDSPSDLKKKFYERCREKYSEYMQVLFYLKEIDNADFRVNLIAQEIREVFSKIKYDHSSKYVDLTWLPPIELSYRGHGRWHYDLSKVDYQDTDFIGLSSFLRSSLDKLIHTKKIKMKNKPITYGVGDSYYNFGDKIFSIKLSDIDNLEEVICELKTKFIPWCHECFDLLNRIESELEAQNKMLESADVFRSRGGSC
ncbi:NACHT domain-containing protein [Lacimicrobium alkaliphilum]|uniref:NACHT domain-containing protein n=1 Tax=Lacimicrobium alkaliphilum TaxID=1526571 RepID=A0A0U2RRA6_9ALTE|nr:ABC transporter ATP-binding protein [Lacimicrobium alkaliphilum]ALS99882.1 hypothetical protein AT746_17500 [Lacimicrobium alkaliphilum]